MLRLLGENYRLDAGDLEALAAAHVLTSHQVVFAEHVGAGLGEAGAVTLVGASGKLTLLGANHPSNLVLSRLVAVRTIQGSGFSLLTLVEKVAFFHGLACGSRTREAAGTHNSAIPIITQSTSVAEQLRKIVL